MQRWIVYGALASLVACARGAESGIADAPLREELLRRVAVDQALRDTMVRAMRAGAEPLDTALLRRVAREDSTNTAWLAQRQPRNAWFTRAQVDSDGMEAAFLLLQHASDTVWQARVLPILTTALARGEISGKDFAYFSDRVAMHRGLAQQFGTQADIRDGRVVFHPIADSNAVDLRRARVGLPPLREYARVLDSVYIGAKK